MGELVDNGRIYNGDGCTRNSNGEKLGKFSSLMGWQKYFDLCELT